VVKPVLELATAGESHGKALVAVLSGMPAGLFITPDDINRDLARRQKGYGRGGRMRIERDCAEVLSGLRHGVTLGSPITMMVTNRDWANWDETMNHGPSRAPTACHGSRRARFTARGLVTPT
jgi:chorismate synthase